MLHPSIFSWNLLNEVARNGQDADEVSYVQSLAAWLHRIDPGRMVSVDVWGRDPPKHAGALYEHVDAVAETDYTGWYKSPLAAPPHGCARCGPASRRWNGPSPGRSW